jgi:autotransporter-associated beta strand protein
MHSPLDVISGRMLGTASAAANLADAANAAKKTAAVTQAHTALMAATGTTADTFAAYAQSGTRPTTALPTTPPTRPTTAPQHLRLRADRRHQRRRQRAEGRGSAAETRQPYLSDAQRRVVLKTTALASGYPVMDDAEGWGRLNLFAGRRLRQLQRQRHHRDGRQQGRLQRGGPLAQRHQRRGKLVKQGTGTLKLAGANSWTGGTELSGRHAAGRIGHAFGAGDVYNSGGTLAVSAPAAPRWASTPS